MKATRSIGRRSFLGRVGGASMFALAGCAIGGPVIDERLPRAPRTEPPAAPPATRSCTDGDSGRHVDPPGRGRSCRGSAEERRRRRR